ncbi:hypothetical protein C8R44DRAFT_750463 [Mycena epipterygia]|nr:hypothetical protein C8R44DRAFT_750463 [Mycena epipterygia]
MYRHLRQSSDHRLTSALCALNVGLRNSFVCTRKYSLASASVYLPLLRRRVPNPARHSTKPTIFIGSRVAVLAEDEPGGRDGEREVHQVPLTSSALVTSTGMGTDGGGDPASIEHYHTVIEAVTSIHLQDSCIGSLPQIIPAFFGGARGDRGAVRELHKEKLAILIEITPTLLRYPGSSPSCGTGTTCCCRLRWSCSSRSWAAAEPADSREHPPLLLKVFTVEGELSELYMGIQMKIYNRSRRSARTFGFCHLDYRAGGRVKLWDDNTCGLIEKCRLSDRKVTAKLAGVEFIKESPSHALRCTSRISAIPALFAVDLLNVEFRTISCARPLHRPKSSSSCSKDKPLSIDYQTLSEDFIKFLVRGRCCTRTELTLFGGAGYVRSYKWIVEQMIPERKAGTEEKDERVVFIFVNGDHALGVAELGKAGYCLEIRLTNFKHTTSDQQAATVLCLNSSPVYRLSSYDEVEIIVAKLVTRKLWLYWSSYD